MKKIADAYKEIISIFLYIIISAFIITSLGFLIVTPMWIAATSYKKVFTFLFFTAFTLYIFYYLVYCFRNDRDKLNKIKINILKTVLYFIILLIISSSFILISNGFYFQAAAIILSIFIFSGLLKYFNFKKE